MLVSISSSKDVPCLSLQGLPLPPLRTPAVPQAVMALMNVPLSLPPMVSVTRSVPAPTASNCGATPGYWACVKSAVRAAPQVTSLRRAPVAFAMTWG